MPYDSGLLIGEGQVAMGQTFIFIRHGTIPIQGEHTTRLPPLAKRALSRAGEQEASAAGVFLRRWLTSRSLSVDRLVLANSRRAQQTASLIFDPLPRSEKRPLRARDPMPQIEAWFADLGLEAVVARVGHGPAFLAVLNLLQPDTPDFSLVFGAVLIVTRRPSVHWQLVETFPTP